MAGDSVPPILQGGWKRRWIKNSDGSFDDTSVVIWLQFEHRMVDVRFAADRAELADRGSLENCDQDDLVRLADSDSSSGHTTCTPVLEDEAGLRTATAEWFSKPGVEFQPQSAFPEPGFLKWNADASIMMERAPSGAYLEQWNRIVGTEPGCEPCLVQNAADGSELFVLGPLAVLVHDRREHVPTEGRLVDLIAAGTDVDQARALLDCEFSLAQRQDDRYVISASSHPWRIGDSLDV